MTSRFCLGTIDTVMSFLRKNWSWLVLGVYWPLMFASTHIPRLPEFQIYGSDVTLHFCAYCILTGLFWLARYGVRKPGWREKSVYFIVAFMACYAALDEITQKLVNRHCSFTDWLADMAGCVTALVLLRLVRSVRGWLALYVAALALLTHWPDEKPFFELPASWQQFDILFVFCGYLGLTLLSGFALLTCPKCTLNATRAGLMLVGLLAFAGLDEVVNPLLSRSFNLTDLLTAVAAIVVGTLYHGCLHLHRLSLQRTSAPSTTGE